MHSQRRNWATKVAFAVVFVFWGVSSFAQTFRGGISGNVADASGAIIAGAEVKATNDGNGQLHQTVSSSAGEFTFQDIPLGTYTITVSAPGFQTLRTTKVP